MEKSGTIMHDANMHLNRSRRVFVPVTALQGSGTSLSLYGGHASAQLPDADNTYCAGNIRVPANYLGTPTLSVIVTSYQSGDVNVTLSGTFGGIGEPIANTSLNRTDTFTIVADQLLLTSPLILTGLTIADVLGCDILRNGNVAADTLTVALFVIGFIFDYDADQ